MSDRDEGGLRGTGRAALALGTVVLASCAGQDNGAPPSGTELVEVLSVGVMEGAPDELFGRIDDVRASDNGAFYVFDGQTPSVAWFSDGGEYLGGVRATGEGPGELARPLAVAVSSVERLAVLDAGNGRMSIFRASADGLGYERQFATTWSAALGTGRGLCAIDDRFFAAGPRGEHILHEIGGDGEIHRSFGQVAEASEREYGPFAQLVVPQLNTGHLLCAGDAGLLVLARPFSSRVEAHAVSGELRWEIDVPDIDPRRIVLTERGLGTESTGAEGSHELLALAPWTANTVLVQYEWRPEVRSPDETGSPDGAPLATGIPPAAASAGAEQPREITSVELRLSDGAEVARWSDLPRVADVKDGRVYSFENLPYPRVRVLERAH